MKITLSLGLDRLALSCSEKQKFLKNLGQSLFSLKSNLNAAGILNDLREESSNKTTPKITVWSATTTLISPGKLLTEPWI